MSDSLVKSIDILSATLRLAENQHLLGEHLAQATALISDIEDEMNLLPHETWLLGSSFRAVDIKLGVLLYHLERINLSNSFLRDRPNLANFWTAFQERSSVQQVLFGGAMFREESKVVRESGASKYSGIFYHC